MGILLRFFFIFLIINQLKPFEVLAQNDSLNQTNVFELNIENILNQRQIKDTTQNKISSVSSRTESYFEVPLAASVVSKEMIRNAGCLTLPEALRLMPGVLVRETSAGNFDIRIRGLSNISPAQDFVNNTENMLLVMVDNRPVFNYYSGGTLWESLPIDINDIERIELIRGPAAALYGPNAVNGVIHFITQKATENGMFTRSTLSWGNRSNLFINTALGYRFNEKLMLGFSGNFAQLHRLGEDYYDLANRRYGSELAEITSYQTLDEMGEVREVYSFPKADEALKRFAINSFINYAPFKNWQMDLQFGFQESNAIYPISENSFTPLSTAISETQYINFKSRLFGSTAQVSYLGGEQEPGRGFLGGSYVFSLFDANVDYNFKFGNLYLKPAFNFRQAVYDDENAEENELFGNVLQILNGRKTLSNVGLSLQADYQWRNFRWIAAIRQDKIDVLAKPFWGFQLAFTYQINNRHLLRLSYGKANRSLFMTEAFTNYLDRTLIPVPNTNLLNQLAIQGNTEVNVPAINSAELGYRFKLNENWIFEAELFYAQGSDFLARFARITPINATTIRTTFVTQNDQLSSIQKGLMLSVEYNDNKDQLRAFLSIQRVSLQNFSPFDTVNDQNKVYTINNYRATPNWFGGVYWNHRFNNRWSLNLNTYFFGHHEVWHRVDRAILGAEYNRGAPVQSGIGAEVKTKVVFNAKLSYSPAKQITTFINIRNLLNQTNFEYYYTDKLGITLLGGIYFVF
jgi:iron complex outermembrane recepter protein